MSSSKDMTVGQRDSEGLLARPLTLQAWELESGPRTRKENQSTQLFSHCHMDTVACVCAQCVGVYVRVRACVGTYTHR